MNTSFIRPDPQANKTDDIIHFNIREKQSIKGCNKTFNASANI